MVTRRQLEGNSFWSKTITLVFPNNSIRVRHIRQTHEGNKFKGARLFEEIKTGNKVWLPKHALLPVTNKKVVFLANSTVKVRESWLEDRAGMILWILPNGNTQQTCMLRNSEQYDYSDLDDLLNAEQAKQKNAIESYSEHLNNREAL